MRNLAIVCLWVAFTAAYAGAYEYIHEDFEGAFPPAGWTPLSGHWVKYTGGPAGSYIGGDVIVYGSQVLTAAIDSPPMTVPVDTTLYYWFQYQTQYYGTANILQAGFYLYYVGTGSQLTSVALGGWNGGWRVCSGSTAVTVGLPVKADWWVRVSSFGTHTAGAFVGIDTVRMADGEISAVAPASLGKVRALFR